jgi:hypothetical protein
MLNGQLTKSQTECATTDEKKKAAEEKVVKLEGDIRFKEMQYNQTIGQMQSEMGTIRTQLEKVQTQLNAFRLKYPDDFKQQ